ncbi:MAG TPA: hypothetical protein VNN18_08300 [Candidatus Xenobia bacterium]|nr:hypothetical protein [Candidatus Xenobia bacterium]
METTTVMQFRLEQCERCARQTIQALRDDRRICSGCEPAAFERAAVEAGRSEFLR